MPKSTFVRLARDVVPKNYVLTLKSDLKGAVTNGTVDILLTVHKSCQTLLLDCLDLKINECYLSTNDGTCMNPTQVRLLLEDERLELTFESDLPKGECTLSISFEGVISEFLRGFYLSKTRNAKGDYENFAVTQFAATEARRCFPCWDEPSFKATFEIILIIQTEFQAISNMNSVEETKLDDDWKKIRFAKTPKMSSYLVAFTVGKYDYLEGKTKSGVQMKVYTQVGLSHLAQFALKVSIASMEFYEDYFNVPYELPKADLLSVANFGYGAMENWGLVMAREVFVLCYEQQTGAQRKQRNAVLLCHEFAHQWFGNLVTMDWWMDLWLNEGFAQFMEHLCMDRLFPEYQMWSQFSLRLDDALELDALDSSHPLEVPINHPSETDEIFDKVSYDKGASIIRMLYNYIGDEHFRKGLRDYLLKYRHGNAQTKDLWNALQESTSIPIRDIMKPWTAQMGFPLLSVRLTNDTLVISQEKFYSNSEKASKVTIKPTWKVPITILTSTSETPIKMLLEDQSTEFKLPQGTKWVHANTGATGVYRVMYDEPLLNALITVIKEKRLRDEKDRHIIHADLVAQVMNNYRGSVQLLELTSAFENEDHYIVWVSITKGLKLLARVFQTEADLYQQICKYARKMYSKIFASLGWDNKPGESHSQTLLRCLVIRTLVYFDDEAVVAEARKKFQNSDPGKCDLPNDLKDSIYEAVVKSLDESSWKVLLNMYKTAALQDEAQKILLALATTKEAKFIARILEMNLSDEVRSHLGPFVLETIAHSELGRKLLWSHYTNNHTKYNERFGQGRLLADLIYAVTSHFTTLEMADIITTFFDKHPIAGGDRSLLQSRETVLRNAGWLQRDKACLKKYFDEHP